MISPVIFVDIIFAVAMLGLGFAIGVAIKRQAPSGDFKESDKLKLAIGKLRDLTSTVAQDVDQHSTRVREISDELVGADMSDTKVQKLVADSVAEIMQANERLQQQLATAEVKMQRQAEEIETQAAVARTDALTGLYNRRAFDDELHRRTAEWQRRKIVFALMMIDVDHFKKFNDQHGHPAGDEVLRRVAGVLQHTMREMDLVTRYGGEEFAIILPVTNLQESLRAAERARQAIAESSFSFEGAELKVTVSIGVAQIFDTEDEATLVKRSDSALYAAKSAGRNRIHLHDTTRCLSASEFWRPPRPPPRRPASRPLSARSPSL